MCKFVCAIECIASQCDCLLTEMKLGGGRGVLSQSLPVRSESNVMASSSLDQELGVKDCHGSEGKEKEEETMEEENEEVLKPRSDVDSMNIARSVVTGCGVTEGAGERLTVQTRTPSTDLDSPRSESLQSSSRHPHMRMSSPVKSKPDGQGDDGCHPSVESKFNHTVATEEWMSLESPSCAEGFIPVQFDKPNTDTCSVEPERMIEFDLEMVSQRLKSLTHAGGRAADLSPKMGGLSGRGHERSRFRAKIEPCSNSAAEKELSREVR